MSRLYRRILIVLISIILAISMLLVGDYKLSKENVIDAIRSKDPLFGEKLYETRLDNKHRVVVFKYAEAFYAPVVIEQFGAFYKLLRYSFEDMTKLGMVETKLDTKAYALTPMNRKNMNLLKFEWNDEAVTYFVEKGDLNQLTLFSNEQQPLAQFEDHGTFFTLTTGLKGSYISGKTIEQKTRSTAVNYEYPYNIYEMNAPLFGKKETYDKPFKFKGIHDYLNSKEYQRLPIVNQAALLKPVLQLTINRNDPIYYLNFIGNLVEVNGQKDLIFYEHEAMYILEVHQFYNDSIEYYELNKEVFDRFRKDLMKAEVQQIKH